MNNETSVEENVTQQNTTPSDIAPASTEPPKKKGKKGVIIAIIIVAVLAVLVGGYFFYIKVITGPKKVFKTTINTFAEDLKADIKENNKKSIVIDPNKPFSVTGDLKVTTEGESYEAFNGLEAKYGLYADTKNNKAVVDAEFGIGANLMSIVMYLVEDALYIDSDNIYPEVLKLPLDEDGKFDLSSVSQSNLSEEQIDHLIDAFADSLYEAVLAGDLSSESAKIKIDGKNVSVMKNILTIDDKNACNIVKAFINKLKTDSEAMKIIAQVSGMTVEELTKQFDETVNSLSCKGGSSSEKIYVNLYTGGLLNKDLKGIDIVFGSGDDKITVETRIGDKTITTAELEGVKFVATTQGDTTTLSVNSEGSELASGKLVNKEDNLSLELNVLGMITLNETVVSKKVSDTEMTFTLGLSMSIDLFGESESLSIAMNMNVNTNAELPSVDITNAKDFSELTEDEQVLLAGNLMNSLQNSGILDLISEIINSTESDVYDDNEDWNTFDGNIDDEIYDFQSAAWFAIDDVEEYEKAVCFTKEYLLKTERLEEDYAPSSFTGSVLVKGDDYFVWASNGTDLVSNFNYWEDNTDPVAGSVASGNCDNLGEIICGADGTCN